MTSFTATNESHATVRAERARIWEALTDTDLLPRLTPFLTRIDDEGEHWTWHLARIPVLSTAVKPSFTERMVFTDKEQIEFHHDPPSGAQESAGVEGWYKLSDNADDPSATDLAIKLEITVDLPVSKRLSPAVTRTMKGVVGQMGRKFSSNLVRHLGAD